MTSLKMSEWENAIDIAADAFRAMDINMEEASVDVSVKNEISFSYETETREFVLTIKFKEQEHE